MASDTRKNPTEMLQQIWWAGVRAVDGHAAVLRSLAQKPIAKPDQIIAVGKAAVAMAGAAVETFGPVPTLAITKFGHATPGVPFEVFEAAHPVPDQTSLAAGARLSAAVANCGPKSHLLLLVSGGASALVESPIPGISLADIITLNRRLLASGHDIASMNAERKRISNIKGGGLLAQFGGARVTVMAISDVQGDAIATIGSGIGDCPKDVTFAVETRIVASNAVAREACAQQAQLMGLPVISNAETLYGDVRLVAANLAAVLQRSAGGVCIWGGEPTVILPAKPGNGGRNQALALLLAREIAGRQGVTILVGGTDGSDGPTLAAGAIVTGATWREPTGTQALVHADSGSFLGQQSALFTTGPTGTNVMDIAVALLD